MSDIKKAAQLLITLLLASIHPAIAALLITRDFSLDETTPEHINKLAMVFAALCYGASDEVLRLVQPISLARGVVAAPDFDQSRWEYAFKKFFLDVSPTVAAKITAEIQTNAGLVLLRTYLEHDGHPDSFQFTHQAQKALSIAVHGAGVDFDGPEVAQEMQATIASLPDEVQAEVKKIITDKLDR